MRLGKTILGSSMAIAMAAATSAAADDPIRVGFWAGGVSAGIGYVLEDGEFLEREGLEPEWLHFTKLSEVNRALASGSIDVSPGGGTIPSLRLAMEDPKFKILMATMIADANFVVLDDSPIQAIDDLKGKTIGSTPPGSTAHALVATILEKLHGFTPEDYEQVPSSDARIAVFLQQGEIDAGLMRTITYRMVEDETDLRIVATVPEEWTRLTGVDAPPILGVAIANMDFAEQNPEVMEKFLAAVMKATRWGAENPEKVAEILQDNLDMDEDEAIAYAESWRQTYLASLEEADRDSIMTMAEIFREAGNLPGEVSRKVFAPGYYEKAKARLN